MGHHSTTRVRPVKPVEVRIDHVSEHPWKPGFEVLLCSTTKIRGHIQFQVVAPAGKYPYYSLAVLFPPGSVNAGKKVPILWHMGILSEGELEPLVIAP